MRDLDETDLEILQLLLSDARRPYSDIAETVGLSAPAVSDRVSRLREIDPRSVTGSRSSSR
jgi:DNA-binding Lrp family transcriptional regulator